ncbi:uncharacterized protein LOC135166605 [Diachasmimorpha longicaudata]|uniref:uncharacterized protein LOC135166605 n=1 Tax=Diachasmimorpha longicaudata TaxID=58733 RepID=UPI0030B90530
MAYSESEPQTAPYGYETTYPYTTSSSGQPITQPLPGQPPLPPMPPPGSFAPMPMFSTMPQVPQLQTWGQAHPWQWITPQAAAPIPTQPARDINNALKQTQGNYARRDRFNHNRNNVYAQRGHFNRNERRRFRHQQQPGQFDPAMGPYWQGIDWQRANFGATQGDGVVNQIQVNSPSAAGSADKSDAGDQKVKIVSEEPVKKNKPRKPMSQTYPIRNWNLEDAVSALKVENKYNRTVRAQSLIIKFPDPDLNKDIVKEFHSGIENIHFQSPSGPRYCFVQMAENVDIDKAIEDLEKIPFGVGHLKVERKSLRDEDYPQPEEIDPYTLYVGNLPESVNVNEVKNKFPTATRVDVGYAQKMRNTRYAFIRYANVEDSIAAYKVAHNLMWDTRSIIVRFRRQRGNTCLPGETKNNSKKVKDEVEANSRVKKETAVCNGTEGKSKGETIPRKKGSIQRDKTSVAPTAIIQQNQPWTSKSPPQASEAAEPPPPKDSTDHPEEEIGTLTAIKEEPQDYDELDMTYIPMGDDDSDDENDEPDEINFTNDEMDEYDDNDQDDNDDSDNLTDFPIKDKQDDETNSDASDHLDRMFSAITNTAGDIEL